MMSSILTIAVTFVAGLSPLFAAPLERRVASTHERMLNLGKALESYYADCGVYPAEGQGLAALVRVDQACKNWKGPYLEKGFTDAWGRSFIYNSAVGQDYYLHSLGADRRVGGYWEESDLSIHSGSMAFKNIKLSGK